MIVAAAVGLLLITLHAPDGRPVYVNPKEITTVVVPRTDSRRTITDKANCVVYLTDRHFFPVIETCAEILNLLGSRQ